MIAMQSIYNVCVSMHVKTERINVSKANARVYIWRAISTIETPRIIPAFV